MPETFPAVQLIGGCDALPPEPTGRRCRRCCGNLWTWEPGPRYPVTVCDGCLEVTLPAFAGLFDSGAEYLGRAEDLRAFLAKREALRVSDMPAIAGSAPALTGPQGALPDRRTAATQE